ncbi:MAG: phosphoribosylanthranilate isomerase [Tannerella sp.]|jgi:phosphoribosylanthranilate isomerase|nr:phosphoribosylanthranilate isomerase [Tannerella sp.]
MKIKVCGMRDPENIRHIEAFDVDFIGFVFYAKSPRYVLADNDSVEAIRQCIKPKVGVFVNETLEQMLEKAELYQLSFLQLHGNETSDLCGELRQRGYSVIKAFSVASVDDIRKTENYPGCCDYFLFDTKCAGYGGSGNCFDWSLLDAYNGNTPFLLSGGLSPDCVLEIKQLRHSGFAGIDLNSGFEISPAIKDTGKLKDFITEIRKSNIG